MNKHPAEKQAFTSPVSWKKSLRLRFAIIFIVVQLLLCGAAVAGLSYICRARIELTGIIIPLIFFLSAALSLYTVKRAMREMSNRLDSMTEELKEAEELAALIIDTCPMAANIWSDKLELVDCNKAALRLYGFDTKQEYIDKFYECMPEYQLDGRLSAEKAEVLLKNAFEKGMIVFEWMHKMPDGSLMHTEVTLVRVNSKNSPIAAGYIRDLRETEQVEAKIRNLETEVQKVYNDALTGIYNRRYFDENFERIIKSTSRAESVLSLMMIDIDKFGLYNNVYGHVAGDACLRAVAEAIARSVTRGDDFVARYGGEEFVVVLPNTDEAGARLMADKILKNIAGLNIPHEQSEVADFITVSIGVATVRVIATPHKPKEAYVNLADKMLYESKQNGRNRYTFGFFEKID